MVIPFVKILTSNKLILSIWSVIAFLLVASWSLSPEDLPELIVSELTKISLIKIALVLLLISFGLLISLLILHIKQKKQINFQTCNWLSDPGIWEHKINGIEFCPTCHSPLSSEAYCAKCERGYGKGKVFTVNW